MCEPHLILVQERFKICTSDSRGRAISALTVSKEDLGCQDARIRALIGRGFVEISANLWIAPAEQTWMRT